MNQIHSAKRKQFDRDGFYVFQNILEPELIRRLTDYSLEALARWSVEHPEAAKNNIATGSMVLIDWQTAQQYDAVAELIAHPKMKTALVELGFAEPKFGHGKLISKPPKSPPLFWHEDGRFWNDPISYIPRPIQCFLMYYLTDTVPENGCLRVIPGSHRNRHPLHDVAQPEHGDELRMYTDPGNIQFRPAAGEIDVPVQAGDLVIGYGTIFHAAYANESDRRRTLLTMWYYPDFVDLPERTQATVADADAEVYFWPDFSPEKEKLLQPWKMTYNGNAELIEQEWKPGKALQ